MSDDDSTFESRNEASVGVAADGESVGVDVDAASGGGPNDEGVEPRPTVAVQFVLEVEDESVAKRFLDRLPGPEETGVSSVGYRSYVDSAGLRWPVVGASVPYFDRRSAEELYQRIRGVDGAKETVRSGTLVIRRFDGGVLHDEEPTVVAAKRYP